MQRLIEDRAAVTVAENSQIDALQQQLSDATGRLKTATEELAECRAQVKAAEMLHAALAAAQQRLAEVEHEAGTVEARVELLLAERRQALSMRAEQLDLDAHKLTLKEAQLEQVVRLQVEKAMHTQVAALTADAAALREQVATATSAVAEARLGAERQERDRFDQQLHQLEQQYLQREAAARSREQDLRTRLEEAYEQLSQERIDLQQREAAAQQVRRTMEAERVRLASQKAELEMRSAELDASALYELQYDLQAASQRVQFLEEQLARVTQEHEALHRRLQARTGGDADALQLELDRLRGEYTAALDRLAQLEPRAAEQQLLRERARRADELTDRLATLEVDQLKYQEQLGKALIKATEADLNAAKADDYYLRWREEVRYREADVAARKQLVTTRFAEFQSVWEDPALQALTPTEPWDLQTLAETARHRLAQAGYQYPPHVIQNFVAALASARLVILAGLSGTGKTSLPVMLAKSFGFGCRIIPVEPRWRDKSDLFGWSNPMDGSFTATEFAKALVEAATPRYRNMPYLIVLDEMNLAHVEYYFAEIHSSRFIEMEQPSHQVKLVDVSKMEGVSLPFLHNGLLQVPENVWFIGTINQDHTVKEISDRVYDRAQVIQFERWSDVPPPAETVAPANAPHYRSLLGTKPGTSGKFNTFLEELRKGMQADLFTNFGSRVEQAFGRYLPAFQASGGSVAEGLDLQLCAKLMPKIELAGHRLSPDRLISFRSRLNSEWQKLSLQGTPAHFIRALTQIEEARR